MAVNEELAMKPLYRYTFDVNTGRIEKLVITDYEYFSGAVWTQYTPKPYYRYKNKGAWCYAYPDDFEAFKNNRVYSWNDEIESVKHIISQALLERLEKVEAQVRRYTSMLNNLRNPS